MGGWDFLVHKADLSRTLVQPAPEPNAATLSDGETLLKIERFSLTANNITYGVVGNQLGYWRFFPAAEGWGRIPVWGFARVLASRAEGITEGLRLFGYWPMSTHLVARLRPSGSGYVDEAEHRAALPRAYNRYELAPQTANDDYLALLRPLFTTSFLLDDYLSEFASEATPILSSASSRTALGLAWLLAQRGQPAVALTSARNKEAVEALSLYKRVVVYSDISSLEVEGPVAYVDMAGDASLRATVHRRFTSQLVLSAIVGSTHYTERTSDCATLVGPRPAFFFAPDRLIARQKDWGADELNTRITDAMSSFIAASDWLSLIRHEGPDALSEVYHLVLSGEANLNEGHIVVPSP